MRCKNCGHDNGPTNMESLGYAAMFTGLGLLIFWLLY